MGQQAESDQQAQHSDDDSFVPLFSATDDPTCVCRSKTGTGSDAESLAAWDEIRSDGDSPGTDPSLLYNVRLKQSRTVLGLCCPGFAPDGYVDIENNLFSTLFWTAEVAVGSVRFHSRDVDGFSTWTGVFPQSGGSCLP